MYPTLGGNNIGTLLRMIQEDQNKNLVAPGVEVGSPIRGMVQQPLMSNEAPGSNRVISVRPEGVTPMGPEMAGVAPVAPVAPMVSAPSSPMGASDMGSSPVAPRVSTPSMPSIGTSIKASTSAPTNQGFIGPVKPNNYVAPTPTPTPKAPIVSQSNNVGSSRIGGLGLGTKIAGAAERETPALLEGILGKAAKFLGPIGTVIGADQLLKSIMGGSFLSPKKAY